MAKSFCYGCKHWKFCNKEYGDSSFYYCYLLGTFSLSIRREFCGGIKLREPKEK